MKAHGLRLMALCSIPMIGACAEDKVGSEARGLELAIAPLQLPGIGQACFDLEVTNAAGGAGDTVWSKGTPGHQIGSPDNALVGDPDAVCSSQYGNGAGGDITYIGPCDADGPDTDDDGLGERMNSVTVWFDGLYYADGSYINPNGADGWQDPCGTAGCTLDVLCEENTDALVEFNFTVLRDAQQGFFDILVNFKDVFCSGKYDTCYDPEDKDGDGDLGKMELLFGDGQVDSPGRDYTGVLALACSGGVDGEPRPDGSPNEPGDPDTLINYSQIFIRCWDDSSAETFTINANAGAGQHTAVSVPGGVELEYAIYQDSEELTCDDPETDEIESCNKIFLNFAFNLEDLDGYNCALQAQATAQSSDDIVLGDDGLLAAENSSHPFINVAIKDMMACQQNPLNGDNSHMGTFYASNFVNGAHHLPMCFRYDGVSVKALEDAIAMANTRPVSADLRLSKELFGRFQGVYGESRLCDGEFSGERTQAAYQAYELNQAIANQDIALTKVLPSDSDEGNQAAINKALGATQVEIYQYSIKDAKAVPLVGAGVNQLPGVIQRVNAQAGDYLIIGYKLGAGAIAEAQSLPRIGYDMNIILDLQE